MTERAQPSSSAVIFQTNATQGQPAGLIAVFQFAPEHPEPGRPGKKPGDLVIESKDNTLTVIVSLGAQGNLTLETVRRAGGELGKWLANSGADHLDIDLDSLQANGPAFSQPELAEAVLVGTRLGAYRFQRYKQPNGQPEQTVTVGLVSGRQPVKDEDLVQRVNAITNAVILARDLAHEPANVINPPSLAERAQQVAEKYGLSITVLDEQQLEEMDAGAILAVGKGSRTPPRMIILEYPGQNPPPDARPVVIIGKAITFDTGGYSLKNKDGIVGMKYDKCGGADVLAIMQAAAELKLPGRLVGIISAAENMVSDHSYRPDDIITSLSGKTVEIVSTDAEGRLVLADAITYAQREFQPRAIIDMATLTGGVVVALGSVRAGLLSNNDMLASDLFSAGEATGERLWRLPLDDEYSEKMKGEDADLRNSGGREAHCILGGAFLKAFVNDDVPWAHLDIAGVATTESGQPYAPKGATGFGIRLLLEYLQNLA